MLVGWTWPFVWAGIWAFLTLLYVKRELVKEQEAWSMELSEIRAREAAGSAMGVAMGSVPIEVPIREMEEEEGVSPIAPSPSVAWGPRSALQASMERADGGNRRPP